MPDLNTRRIAACLIILAGGLGGCATSSPPADKTVYDFGAARVEAPKGAAQPLTGSPLAMADVQTASGQSSTAMQYRLAYANEQALMPYGLARWSMPPAQLVAQRMRTALSQQRPVVAVGDGQTVHMLQLTLEEFGQNFETPTASVGLVHLRATLFKGDRLLAQRDFSASVPAPTPDAPGGARALSIATHTVAQALVEWVAQTAP